MRLRRITSLSNPQVKKIAKLRERRFREETGLTIVEGIREMLCARENSVELIEVYVCPDLLLTRNKEMILTEISSWNISTIETTKRMFSKIAFGDRKEGILAVCRQPKISFEDFTLSRVPLLVIVVSVEKPGNLGAILRVCDGASVDAVLLCEGATDIYNPNVIRASLGTVFSVKVVQSSNEAALKFLHKRKIKVCSTLPDAKTIYTKASLRGPVGIVLGNEQMGLNNFWKRNSALKIKIPMKGKADSLNVSATAAIVVYEAIRQRNALH